jgi:threonine dehydratase
VRIIAAEPERACDAARSFRAGRIIAAVASETVADGPKVPLRERTWQFASNRVTGILTAFEREIVDATRLTWARMRIVMEPTCVVPLAVISENPDIFAGRRVGVGVTRGTVDLDKLPWMRG